jgi:hypothetical protein
MRHKEEIMTCMFIKWPEHLTPRLNGTCQYGYQTTSLTFQLADIMTKNVENTLLVVDKRIPHEYKVSIASR